MKKYVTLVLTLSILSSCKQEPPKPTYTIISGKIENTQGGGFTIGSRSGYKKTTNIRNDGIFTDTLNIEDGYFYLNYANKGAGLYLSKGSKCQYNF